MELLTGAIVENGAKIGENVKIGYYSIVKAGAEIGDNTVIGDFCIIEGKVKIGSNNKIFSHVHIVGNTTIGDENAILSGVKIGFGPKDISDPFYEGVVEIGDKNFIGENTVVNCGENSAKFGNVTRIADRCYIMNLVTIHHNNQIGFGHLENNSKADYDTIICSGVQLNGFVAVRKGANIGCNSAVHQFRWIGEGALVAMGSAVVRDIIPFSKFIKGRIVGINQRPLEQFLGVSEKNDIDAILKKIRQISVTQPHEGFIAEKVADQKSQLANAIIEGAPENSPVHAAARIIANFVDNPRAGKDTAKWIGR